MIWVFSSFIYKYIESVSIRFHFHTNTWMFIKWIVHWFPQLHSIDQLNSLRDNYSLLISSIVFIIIVVSIHFLNYLLETEVFLAKRWMKNHELFPLNKVNECWLLGMYSFLEQWLINTRKDIFLLAMDFSIKLSQRSFLFQTFLSIGSLLVRCLHLYPFIQSKIIDMI